MKYSVKKLSALSLIRLDKNEVKDIRVRLDALTGLLDQLEGFKVSAMELEIAPQGEHRREDVPYQFDSDDVLKAFNELKGRYVKAPRTV